MRQPFARSEVGLNKAIVLVNRLNLFWGLKWEAVPAHLKPGTFISRSYSGDDLRAHIVMGAWIRGPRGLRFAMRLGIGARFPTGSIWATTQIAASSSWVSRLTSEIGGQGYDSDLRGVIS